MPDLSFLTLKKSIEIYDIEVIDIRYVFQQIRFDEEGLGINEEV